MPGERREFMRRSDRIEELVDRLESAGDPAIRAVAQELLQAVIELHGIALERVLDVVGDVPSGDAALARIASDDLVSGVLSLHGIHPVAMEARVSAAIEKVKPYLRSHGGDVELASVEGDTIHVRLQGTCGSCSSSSETMKSHVEEAIFDAAPEVQHVVAESMSPAGVSSPELVILQTN
jgi:Fe-S cluster biogenesis protein NfuA